MSQITIPQEQWGAMIGAAVMQSVTTENRDMLVKEAILHLISPSTNSYDHGKSPLQMAFNNAVEREAGKMINAEMEKDDALLSEVRKMIVEAVAKVTTGDRRQKMVDGMAEAIAAGMKLDRY